MSARAAFVPQKPATARPPSRVSQLSGASPAQNSEDLLEFPPNKPFNLAGVRKRPTDANLSVDNSVQDKALPRRVPVQLNSATRPTTPDVSASAGNRLPIAAPSPMNASAHHHHRFVAQNSPLQFPVLPQHPTEDNRSASRATHRQLQNPQQITTMPYPVPNQTAPAYLPFLQEPGSPISGDSLRSRRRSKRIRSELESEVDITDSLSANSSKKYKTTYNEDSNSHQDNEESIESVGPHQSSHMNVSLPQDLNPQTHFINPTSGHVPFHNGMAYEKLVEMQTRTSPVNEPILDRILGRDVEEYITTHCIDRLETAEKRWKECTMDEWRNGGEEIISKFEKIMISVRDHMATKMRQYADLDARVGNHQGILNKRQQDLQDMQTSVVQAGDKVILGTKQV